MFLINNGHILCNLVDINSLTMISFTQNLQEVIIQNLEGEWINDNFKFSFAFNHDFPHAKSEIYRDYRAPFTLKINEKFPEQCRIEFTINGECRIVTDSLEGENSIFGHTETYKILSVFPTLEKDRLLWNLKLTKDL